ncbi:hypothetical protein HanXRQr2_Chr04g0155991 [Helianthus annuus]|uniref:Uncharacterized protein n=1 Tax=Helianthus annuus TaxID=4232 RepID=A0A9K3J6H9_HELAN|nr:hypothetical protein HanXRQr2_Chr04g0155991 [Helianthus annuus]KAJ0930498.1 hypothetical protein HanPSC8_Chr04g0150001 [Helianthus annuus]
MSRPWCASRNPEKGQTKAVEGEGITEMYAGSDRSPTFFLR